MIKSIRVKNYILIDEITLEFDKGFNVFTGETGAGKSIMISAIDAALGAKVNKDAVKHGADKAFIELEIKLDDNFNKAVLENNGIDIEDGGITVSREITPSLNRFRINGIQVSADFIKELREKILDIHSQHQSYNYVQPKNHIILLDNFAAKEHRARVQLFREKYLKRQALKKELDEAVQLINAVQQKEELLTFQVKEIEEAAVENTDECEILSKELDILSDAERLKELSYSAYCALLGEDGGIIDALGSVKAQIAKLKGTDDSISALEEDFINAFEILKDTAHRLRDYSESKENDPERMNEIGERLSLLEKLKRKYGGSGGSLEEVLKTYENLSDELNKMECSEDNAKRLEAEISVLNKELEESAAVISEKRKQLADTLSAAVSAELAKLELPKARFGISIENCAVNENGQDKVEFLISVNAGEDLRPIAKTASGGEISRIMLALKTVFAQADSTNTVIFDEIDTGISGRASQSAAEAVVNLSKTHQIIMITHQAIIAAKADRHFYVKKEQQDTAKVSIYTLEGENKIKALALLAAGEINEESAALAEKLIKS